MIHNTNSNNSINTNKSKQDRAMSSAMNRWSRWCGCCKRRRRDSDGKLFIDVLHRVHSRNEVIMACQQRATPMTYDLATRILIGGSSSQVSRVNLGRKIEDNSRMGATKCVPVGGRLPRL